MPEIYSFGDLFRKYRVEAGFKTLSQLGEAFDGHGLIFEDSIFSHWQRGSRIPTNRHTLLTLIKIFISHNAVLSITEANLFLESSGHGYITKSEALELFPRHTKKIVVDNTATMPSRIIDFQPVINADLGRKIAQIYVDNDIARFNFKYPFTFSTGLKSPIFVDNRLLLSFPKERSWIMDEMVKCIRENIPLENIDYISSSLSFAAPFGTLISNALSLPLILTREHKASYGRFSKIEGHLSYGKRVLIVEDIISTGVGAIDNCETVRKAGGKTHYCVVIFDYEIDIVKRSLEEHGLKTFALVNGADIINEARRKNRITEDEKKEVQEWLKTPFKWGKMRGYYDKDSSLEDYYKD